MISFSFRFSLDIPTCSVSINIIMPVTRSKAAQPKCAEQLAQGRQTPYTKSVKANARINAAHAASSTRLTKPLEPTESINTTQPTEPTKPTSCTSTSHLPNYTGPTPDPVNELRARVAALEEQNTQLKQALSDGINENAGRSKTYTRSLLKKVYASLNEFGEYSNHVKDRVKEIDEQLSKTKTSVDQKVADLGRRIRNTDLKCLEERVASLEQEDTEELKERVTALEEYDLEDLEERLGYIAEYLENNQIGNAVEDCAALSAENRNFIRALEGDRDHLNSQIGALERQMDDFTGTPMQLFLSKPCHAGGVGAWVRNQPYADA